MDNNTENLNPINPTTNKVNDESKIRIDEINSLVIEFDTLLKILNSRGLFVEEYTYLSLLLETVSETFKEEVIDNTILLSFNKR